MKTIAGAILIVAASVFYHARIELAERKIGYIERMGLIKVCLLGSAVTGVAGILLILTELRISGTNSKEHQPDPTSTGSQDQGE